ncbi:MAG: hypothetical protein GY720_20400 [bacterium]|nr:hypothetical protein [bacterium]
MTDPPLPPIMTITSAALKMLLEVRDRESDADELALVIAISGVSGDAFTYQIAFMRVDGARPDDVVIEGELPIIVSAGDVENLRGAAVAKSRNLLEPGLIVENPNSPSPQILGNAVDLELTGSVAERVVATVEHMINPSIAGHGGVVEVVAVEESTAYVRLGGGCQGCGMASVTLKQGIEATLRQVVPEVQKVIDVTDHSTGDNPYYEQAKK